MDDGFKKKLLHMYDYEDSHSRWGKRFPESELKQLIRYGAMGEMGEHYYLFIYRDFYRETAYYGAIIFFNKMDELQFPVTVMGMELDGQERIRNVYVKAALYFLKKECQNTLAVAGNIKIVFDMAKDKINTFIGASTPIHTNKLDTFNWNNMDHSIHYHEIKLKKISKTLPTRGLTELLEQMVTRQNFSYKENNVPPTEENAEQKVKPALNLKSQILDLTGEKYYYFQLLLLPILQNGELGKPQRIPKTGLHKQQLALTQDEWQQWQAIEPFFDHMIYIDNQPGNAMLRVNLLFHLYFQTIAREIFKVGDEFTFCQLETNAKEYLPLRKLRFSKIGLSFAPSLQDKKDYELRFFLTFYGVDGEEVLAQDGFEIIFGAEEAVYVLITTAEGNTWLAVPEEPLHVYGLLLFLKEKKTCHSDDFEEILTALKNIASPYLTIQEEPLKKYMLKFLPQPLLKLYPPDSTEGTQERLVIAFNYMDRIKDFVRQNPDKMVCTYTPDTDFENHCLEILHQDPGLVRKIGLNEASKEIYHYYEFKNQDALKWLVERGSQYLEKGFAIFSMKWKRFLGHTTATLNIHLKSDINWLEFTPVLQETHSGKIYELDLNEIDYDNQVVLDKDGRLHLVTRQEIEKLQQLSRYAQRDGNVFRVPSKNYILINKLYDKKMEEMTEIHATLKKEKRLRFFEKIADYPLANEFNGQLRGYQREGFKWLCFLQDYGFAGCLADDMGLGKTVQTLALLQSLKTAGKLATSLLVVPVSAIRNWEMEIEKFTPHLSYYRHIGAARDKDTKTWYKNDLVITSYATLRNDIDFIKDFPLDYVILDESQNIKTATSQISKATKILTVKNRLALSGTPVENNSLELWSLFDFLMPGFLGTLPWFVREFAQPIEKEHDEERAELLKRMIFPFILRRKKEDVAQELPEKIEIVSKLRMEPEQFRLYNDTAQFLRQQLAKEISEKGVGGASIHILEGMLRLRQICLFPHLVDEHYRDMPSVKFNHLKDLLEDILAEGHKVLIFSQFVQVLQVIKSFCEQEGILYSYLDGSVKVNTRAQMIADFQEKESTRVFLLSLKAGGVALNLTAADYVIIFDPWWNPAVEAQAIDRSHRWGQTRNVMVYRMVVEGTIEEKMLQLQDHKKALMDQLISADSQSFKNLTHEDVLELFKFSEISE